MESMFSGCSSLKELNFPNFNTNNAIKINMDHMFYRCSYHLQQKIKDQHKNIENKNFAFEFY